MIIMMLHYSLDKDFRSLISNNHANNKDLTSLITTNKINSLQLIVDFAIHLLILIIRKGF